jgi:CRP/FNR family transcriptional regulator
MNRAGRPPSRAERPALNCFNCQNRERSEWCAIQADDLRLLNEQKQCAVYRSGETLYQQGDSCDGIFILERGTIAVRKTDRQGHSVVLRLCHGGQTLGYRDYFAGGPYTTSADALADSTVCYLERPAVQTLLTRNPSIGLRFVQRIAQDLESAEEAILQTSALPVRARMAHLLLMLKERFGTAGDDGSIVMELPLARQDIAALLGARPETVTRTLHALEVDGVARFSGRTAVIPDLDLLLDEVEFADGP